MALKRRLSQSVDLIMPRTGVSIAAAGNTFDTTLIAGARATRYILELPDYTTGSPTTTLSFINANSVTVFTGAAHPENANYSIPIDVELVETYTVRLTLSGVAGGATTAYITILGD